uniref:DUF1771 domain-containing protein n=1 Tax=Ananas comosus var. bracteatus TaxID=296719 RepID=A0A6V7PLB8_ANACO|nr:unnamed protein product [Ananas comosus var. bracteatus]
MERDDETRALESLFDAFGSCCSLEEIASAYCTAKGDVNRAGDILYNLEEAKSRAVNHEENCESKISQSEEIQNATIINKYPKGSRDSKQRKFSASTGTVSSVLGKTYKSTSSSTDGLAGTTKPLKIIVEGSTTSGFDMKHAIKDDVGETEEFLFSMLGDGYKLSIDEIREVLGCCGYDIKKSMEELLALSTKTVEKGKTVDYKMVQEPAEKCLTVESSLSEESLPQSRQNWRDGEQVPDMQKEKSNLPREVLESLFTVAERSEEKPEQKRHEVGLSRPRFMGRKVVREPLELVNSLGSIEISKEKVKDNVHVEEDDYQTLRKAAKQQWDTMKAYYESAADAFTKGDRQQANYLLEQGKYHYQLAREADEKNTEIRQDLPLNLSSHLPKEAVRTLEMHLTKLANIPGFQFLKVTVDNDGADGKEGKINKRVKSFLQKKSINWIEEEGNPGIIFIRLDQIDPSKLNSTKDSD